MGRVDQAPSRATTYPVLPKRLKWRDAHRVFMGADDSMRRPRLRSRSASHLISLARQEGESVSCIPACAEQECEARGIRNHCETARRLGKSRKTERESD